MALMTHPVQGSYAAFPSRPVPWRRRMEPKRLLLRSIFVKRKSCLCVGAPLVQGSKGRSLIIVSFKGKNESGGRESGSKSAKNSADCSCVPQDGEETLAASSKVQNGQLSSMSEADKKLSGSLAIQNLFKSWLTLLHTPSPDLVVDGTLEGPPSLKERSEMNNVTPIKGRGEILKVVWFQFWGLDATIKMPILIVFPFCVAVTLTYGPRTSKELAPCWIGGALLFALWVEMFKLALKLCAKACWQTGQLIKAYPLAVYDFIVSGKLLVKSWQLLLGMVKWLDPKYVKERAEAWWAAKNAEWDEKWVDFVEIIWPHYCRFMRTLKRARLL